MLMRFFCFFALVWAVCVAASSPCFATATPAPAKKAVPKAPSTSSVLHGSSLKLPTGTSGGTHLPFGIGGGTHDKTTGTNGWKPPAGLSTSSKTSGSSATSGTDKADKTDKTDKTGKTGKADKTGRAGGDKSARIANPHQSSAFGWNNGAEWTPQGHFWGGGFWGPVPAGISAGTNVTVDPSSPGYTLFANYGLVEAPCDYTKHQVEVYGPDVSMVCAEPNALVPVGRYKVDYSTLSLEVTDEE